MKSIVREIFDFYEEINCGKYKWIKEQLHNINIRILSDFISNKNIMEDFYNTYVTPYNPKIVICGINPGRFGAGKTGVPFLDFTSLSKMIKGVNREESEASSRYFYSIINHFSKEKFYSNFYVTNISWVGFSTITKPIKNVNYYDLPKNIQDVIIDNFVYEMKLVNPTHIISCSNKVLRTLTQLKAQNKINANIKIKLNHPYYCSIKNNTPKEYLKYIKTLENFIAE